MSHLSRINMIVEFKTLATDGGAHTQPNTPSIPRETVGDLIDNILEATELHFEEEIEKGELITIITTPKSSAETTSDMPVIKFGTIDIAAKQPVVSG